MTIKEVAEEELSPSPQFTANTTTIATNTIIIRFHPEYEKIVPRLKPEEYQQLKSSIAENGLYHPIIINKDGFVLDGHHRVRACLELGIEEKKQELKFEVKSFDNPYLEKIFVIDTNLTRRQLEPYSRVELV